MFFRVTILLVFLCMTTICAAETTTHQSVAEELLVLMKVDQAVDELASQIKEMQMVMAAGTEVPDGAEDIMKAYDEKITAYLEGRIGWEHTKDQYIALYTEAFSEAELRDLLDFYRSPTGKKYVESVPFLREASVALARQSAAEALPGLEELTEAMQDELKQSAVG